MGRTEHKARRRPAARAKPEDSGGEGRCNIMKEIRISNLDELIKIREERLNAGNPSQYLVHEHPSSINDVPEIERQTVPSNEQGIVPSNAMVVPVMESFGGLRVVQPSGQRSEQE